MSKRYIEDGVAYVVDPSNEQVREAGVILGKYAEFVQHCMREFSDCDVKTQDGRDGAVTCLGAAAYAAAQLAEHLVGMYSKNLEQLPEDVRDSFDREIAIGVRDGLRLVTGLSEDDTVEIANDVLPDRKANLH